MKISLHWLNKHIDLDKIATQEIADKLTFAGLEVEDIEEVSSIKGGLNGLVVGEVLTCEKIPETEKLKITTVNIGQEQMLNIVCGADNVAPGIKVIVATVGTTIYPKTGEAITIKKAKIRGCTSEGMLCAEDEIGLSDSHAGIIVLPKDIKVGTLAKDYYNIETNTMIEIGLTANRGDAASHRGVARDLSALLNKNLLPQEDIDLETTEASPINVKIHSDNCPRYSGIYIKNVTIKPSPDWLKAALKTIGIEPINNVVDASNYILHDLGQPIHAFDAEKIKDNTINIRQAKNGETLVTLDKTERKLSEGNLVIADAEKPLAIAGIFGGLASGISAETKNIFIESAYFNPVSIRKTAKQFGLNTDASFRYERGCDPDITMKAMAKMANLVLEIAGGSITKPIDNYPKPIEPFKVTLRFNQIKRIIGIEIPTENIRQILTHLAITIVSETDEQMILEVPSFKGEVYREIDVIEELIRIYGFEHIPLKDNTKLYLTSFKPSNLRNIQQKASLLLQGLGFTEIMNNSMIAMEAENEQLVKLTNPLSAETNTMRPNLELGMIQSMDYNLKRQQTNLKFYEFGTTFKIVGNGKIIETPHLAIACAGSVYNESWQFKKKPVDEAFLANCMESLLTNLGVEKKAMQSCYAIKPKKFNKNELKKFKINEPLFYAEINLLKVKELKGITVKDIPNQPAVRRDLSLVLDKSIKYETIEKLIAKHAGNLLINTNVFDVYEGKPLAENEKSYSLSLVWQDPQKSLSDSYIDPIANKLIDVFETELNAVIRR